MGEGGEVKPQRFPDTDLVAGQSADCWYSLKWWETLAWGGVAPTSCRQITKWNLRQTKWKLMDAGFVQIALSTTKHELSNH